MSDEKTQPVDPVAVLTHLEAKKAALEALIASWRKALELGALGPSRFPRLTEAGPVVAASPATGHPMELPVGMLLGKNLPDAIKLYLCSVGSKQTNKEIEAGLKEHGVESTAKRFSASVAGALFRLKKLGQVVRFKDGWLLAEQLSPHLRAKLSQGNSHGAKPKRTKRRGRPPRKEAVAEAPLGQVGGPKPEDRVLSALQSQPGTEMSLHELADSLKMPGRVVNAVLTNLAKKKVVQRTPGGKCRMVI